jgi:hypothetical protein
MPFTKITGKQSDGSALQASLQTYEAIVQEREAIYTQAKSDHSKAAYELGPPADPAVDEKSLSEALEKDVQSRILIGDIASRIDVIEEDITSAREKKATLAEAVTDANAFVQDCQAEIQEYESANGAIPPLTDKERAWLAEFSKVSPTPPSQTKQLMVALEKAQAGVAAAQRAEQDQDGVIAQLQQELAAKQGEKAEAEQKRDEIDEQIKQLRKRKEGHAAVYSLKLKLEQAEKLKQGDVTEGVTMAQVMAPYHVLHGELAPEVGALVAALAGSEGVNSSLGAIITGFENKLSGTLATINRLEALGGDEAQRSAAQLADLASGLNEFADEVTNVQTVELPKSRKALLSEQGEAKLQQEAAQLPKGEAVLPAQLKLLARTIRGFDFSDWNACLAGLASEMTIRLKALSDENDRVELLEFEQQQKLQLFEAEKQGIFDAFADTSSIPLQTKNQIRKLYFKLADKVRAETTSLADFEEDTNTLVLLCEESGNLQDDIDARLCFKPAGWREELGLTGSKNDWAMVYDEDGEFGGRKWNLHYSVSNDAIATGTTRLRLPGANEDTLFQDLFVSNVQRKNRMHATFTIAGNDSNVHLYLGDGTYYREGIIPNSIRNSIKGKMATMQTKFTREKTAIIKKLIDKANDTTS